MRKGKRKTTCKLLHGLEQATSDGEVSVHQPLLLAWGACFTRADVGTREKAKAPLLPMTFHSADSIAFCFHDPAMEKLSPPQEVS